MGLLEQRVKGLSRCLVDGDLREERLHIHISEIRTTSVLILLTPMDARKLSMC